MNNKPDYYRTLLESYLDENIDKEATEELFEYLATHSEDIDVLLGAGDLLRFEKKISMDPQLEDVVSKRIYNRLLQGIKERKEPMKNEGKNSSPVLGLMKTRWYWAAAAIVFFAVGAYYMRLWEFKQQPDTAGTSIKSNDIEPPQSNQAMITLSDGQIISLQDIGNGTLAEQDNVQVIKLENGEIAYRPSPGKQSGIPLYNTLSNPKGSRVIQMRLSDGTRMWLNAGSSVTYPVQFTGGERRVSVTGETYFEVAHNSETSFIVNKGNTNITVLGTHFNVNAYDDEQDIKVTLLEGRVKVNIPGADCLLTPGQQARIDHSLKVTDNANLDEVMAWKNGLFRFDDADIYKIMRMVARWYDLEVIYEGDMSSDRFQGKISMNTKLSELLEVLELNRVEYSIENKTIRIKSVK